MYFKNVRGLAFKNVMGLAFFMVCSGVAQGSGTEAWWDICDGCTSDSDFSSRAVQIPSHYERVYISNTLTNETRRYQRTIMVDDLWGGTSLTIIANERSMTAHETNVFQETIQNAGAVFIGLPRSRLDGLSGLSGRDSVVGDLSTGMLSGGLLTGLKAYLRTNGYAGSRSDVSSITDVDAWIFSYNLRINTGDMRTEPLIVRITYPDGSSLTIELDKELNEVLSVNGIDAEGNEIVFEENSGNTPPVIPVSGVEYSFGTANPNWGNLFGASLDVADSYTCSSWTSEEYVVVLCSRL